MAAKKPVVEAAVEEVAAKVEDICRACWPDGWPHHARTAGCVHGDFERPDPTAEQAPTPESPTGGTDPETTPKEPTS